MKRHGKYPDRVKVSKVAHSLKMTIPKEIAQAMNIDKGDVLLVSMTDKEMTARKKET